MAIAEKALEDRFDQVKQSDFDPAQFRLSNTGKCQRMRMLKVLGYEAEDFDQKTYEYFERGNVLEDWFADQLSSKYPRKTRREYEVNTPFGDTGHIDIWYPKPPEKPSTIIEVKSVKEGIKYYGLPKEDHVNQVQAYMHFLTDHNGNRRCNQAEIVYIFFGKRLETETYEIKYDPEKGKEIEEELFHLHNMKDAEQVPDVPGDMSPDNFPCFWVDADGNQSNCPYYQHCWADYKPEDEHEEGPIFDDDKSMKELIEKYSEIKENYSKINDKKKQIKQQKKKLEAAIEKKMDAHDTDKAVVGNTRIKKSKTSGRIYWKPERALKQGLIDQDTLEKIRQASDESDGYTRFYTKSIEREDIQ